MTVDEGLEFFSSIPKIARKLQTLQDVGLGYVKIGQSSTTLSGGEAQRVKLATELSKRSTGKDVYKRQDYAGGATDDYTAMVCCTVTKESKISECEFRKIPAGPYAKFVITCSMRTAVAAVGKAWQEIWKINLPRTFICDFEEYQDDNLEHTEIHLYIGLKEKEKNEI